MLKIFFDRNMDCSPDCPVAGRQTGLNSPQQEGMGREKHHLLPLAFHRGMRAPVAGAMGVTSIPRHFLNIRGACLAAIAVLFRMLCNFLKAYPMAAKASLIIAAAMLASPALAGPWDATMDRVIGDYLASPPARSTGSAVVMPPEAAPLFTSRPSLPEPAIEFDRQRYDDAQRIIESNRLDSEIDGLRSEIERLRIERR